MTPALIIGGGLALIAWLRWRDPVHHCACGQDFATWKAIRRHKKDVHRCE